jgi:Trk-type K+ transport system membrane component
MLAVALMSDEQISLHHPTPCLPLYCNPQHRPFQAVKHRKRAVRFTFVLLAIFIITLQRKTFINSRASTPMAESIIEAISVLSSVWAHVCIQRKR